MCDTVLLNNNYRSKTSSFSINYAQRSIYCHSVFYSAYYVHVESGQREKNEIR